MCSTIARSWLMNSSARPNSRCKSCSRLTICAFTETSSADTASSQTISSGSAASARAMPMRWRWPPENSCGRRPSASRGSRTVSISAATFFSSSADDLARPKLRIGSARISRTRMRGLRLEKGSWNTTWTRRRMLRKPPGERSSMRFPSSTTWPEVTSNSRRMARPTVDLPQPDSPTSDSVSPRATSKDTPSTA